MILLHLQGNGPSRAESCCWDEMCADVSDIAFRPRSRIDYHPAKSEPWSSAKSRLGAFLDLTERVSHYPSISLGEIGSRSGASPYQIGAQPYLSPITFHFSPKTSKRCFSPSTTCAMVRRCRAAKRGSAAKAGAAASGNRK